MTWFTRDKHVGSRFGYRLAVLLTVVGLLAAACGRDAETGTSAPSAPPDTGSGTAPDGGGEPTETTAPAAQGLEAGAFGDIGTLCSGGDAQPVTGQSGIEGTTITVGTFSDAGFVGLPGINQEFFDTAKAVVEWCNSHGGVRGYMLKSEEHDSALTEYASKMLDACASDFILVGGGGVLDDTGEKSRLECGLPVISSFSVTPVAANADISLTSLPNPAGELGVAEQRYAEQRWPELMDKTAITTLATPATLTIRDRYLDYFEGTDWKVQYSAEFGALGESSYVPFVQAMKDADVEIVQTVAIEPSVLAALQQAAADNGFEPTAWIVSTNNYDALYLELAGENAKNTFTRSSFWPVELADQNQATADYLELLADGKQSILGMNAMSSWVLFLSALGTCVDAGTVTRDCVYVESAKATDWTGGGLHGALDVTHQNAPGCAVIMEATPQGWVVASGQELEDGGYNCDAVNVAKLSRDYGEGARCPSGVADPLPSTCA